MEDVLSCMYLFTEWKPEIIEQIWDNFIPEKIRYLIHTSLTINIDQF